MPAPDRSRSRGSTKNLALGIGINSALFSVVKSVLLEDLPYGTPDQLVRVWVKNPKQGFDHDVTSFPRFQDWKARSAAFRDFVAFVGARLILTGVQEPRQLQGAAVTANFFRVMGVRPVLGRDFDDGADQGGRPRVVMLSHGFWLRLFPRYDDTASSDLAYHSQSSDFGNAPVAEFLRFAASAPPRRNRCETTGSGSPTAVMSRASRCSASRAPGNCPPGARAKV